MNNSPSLMTCSTTFFETLKPKKKTTALLIGNVGSTCYISPTLVPTRPTIDSKALRRSVSAAPPSPSLPDVAEERKVGSPTEGVPVVVVVVDKDSECSDVACIYGGGEWEDEISDQNLELVAISSIG